MAHVRRSARARTIRNLAIAALASVLVMGGLFFAHKLRKRMLVQEALARGMAAYTEGDLENARLMLGRYVSARPDDAEALAVFADAEFRASPLTAANMRQAITAYRLRLNFRPGDELAFKRLALLYEATGSYGELAFIADKRRAAAPHDPRPVLTLAKALIRQRKTDTARSDLEALVARASTGGVAPRPELVEACLLLSVCARETQRDDAWTEALKWADRAVEYDPQSAEALVQRAALRRAGADAAEGPTRAALLADARADLVQAETRPITDPRTRLVLCEEWQAHGELTRAAGELEATRQVDLAVVREYFADPDDWHAAQFVQAARLALLGGRTEQGVGLAQDALQQFKERPQRAVVLPLAVELLVVGDRLVEARQPLAEYRELTQRRPGSARATEQLAVLEALVARGEGNPYRVIDQLEPLLDQPGTRLATCALLADALVRVGAPGRAVKALARYPAFGALNPELSKRLARAFLAQGAWSRARAALPAGEAAGDDPELSLLRLTADVAAALEQRTPDAQRVVDAAVREIKALREAHPDWADVRVLLGGIAERQGQIDAAEAEFASAIAECNAPLAARLALAALYAHQGRIPDALQVLRQACEKHSAVAAPWLALSNLLVDQRQLDEARTTLNQARELVVASDDRRTIATQLAAIDILRGERAAGIAALRGLATSDPRDVQVRALLLGLPEVLQDDATAKQLLHELREAEGANGVLWRLHQARLTLAGREGRSQKGEVEDLLKYCIQADPGWPAPILLLGQMYEQLGELAAAEQTYRLSDAADVLDRLLPLLSRQGRLADARELLQRLTQKLGEEAVGARRLVLALREGDTGAALREVELRLARPGHDPENLVLRAGLRYRQDRDAVHALGDLDAAAAGGADPLAVARTRVFILKEERRLDEAEAALDELIRTSPAPEAYLLRAGYHSGAGRADLAENDYRALADSIPNAAGHVVLGEFYAQAGRLDEALAAWQQGLALYPEALELKRGLAKGLLVRGQAADRARTGELLAELLEQIPNDADLLWASAVYELGRGTSAGAHAARAALGRAVQASPADAGTYRRLADLALSELREPALARDLALRGLQVNPGDPDLSLQQARAELALNQFDVARQLARSVLTRAPQNVAAHEVLVGLACKQQDTATLQRELTRLQELVRKAPESAALQLLLARTHAALGEPDAALAALANPPSSASTPDKLAVLLLTQELQRSRGDLAAARQALDAAAELVPDNPDVLLARLRLLADEKRFDDVLAAVEDARLATNQRAQVLLSAARLIATSPAHFDRGIQLCREAAELAPQTAAAQLLLGELTYGKGDLSAAEQAYRAAIEADPACAEARNNLAWILAQGSAESAEALVQARKAVELQPADAGFRDTLGLVLKQANKLEEARDEFRQCVRLSAEGSALRAKSLFRLAQVCALLGDQRSIDDYLKEALAVDQQRPVFTAAEKTEIARLREAARPPR